MKVEEFLLARITEDEAEANRAGSFTPWDRDFDRDNYGHLLVQPSRILAECEAKRVAVEWYMNDDDTVMRPTIEAMASIYSDHPDFDTAWTTRTT